MTAPAIGAPPPHDAIEAMLKLDPVKPYSSKEEYVRAIGTMRWDGRMYATPDYRMGWVPQKETT